MGCLNEHLFVFFLQALGLKRDDTFSVTMLGHCIEMYIGDTDAYIGRIQLTFSVFKQGFCFGCDPELIVVLGGCVCLLCS